MKNKKKDIARPDGDISTETFSAEELSMLRASAVSSGEDRSKLPPHDTSDKANFFRLIKKNKLVVAAAIFVALALVVGVVVGSGILVTKLINYHKDFSVVIGDEDPYTVPYKEAVIEGVLYIDVRKIADFSGLTLSGTQKRIQLTATDGSYLLFENENETAFINGGYTAIEAEELESGKRVSAKAYVSADECLVPYTFFVKAVSEDTMKFSFDAETHTIYVKPKYKVYNGDLENKVMVSLMFTTENHDVTVSKGETPEYIYSYSIDISAYLDSITAEHLLLANKSNPLGEDYVPASLTELTCPTASGRTFELQSDAAAAVCAMMLDMEGAGIDDVFVTSAYRSYKYQDNLYWGYVQDHIDEGMSQKEAEDAASEYSSRPGYSEHQTGLCVDFMTNTMSDLDESFENTRAFAWLEQNAHKYGFILRYPKDKVDTTKYKYEPWHYRFVGRAAATEMFYSGECLEEYLGILS